MTTDQKFDAYAETYQQLHTQSVATSGERADYFHDYKMRCLSRLGLRMSDRILDYGCGIGNLTLRLKHGGYLVHGYDPSEKSLEVIRSRAPDVELYHLTDEIPKDFFDVAVMSGVLHHIPTADRADVVREVLGRLRRGGKLIIFEHNPFNPLTKKAVHDCPFDDDAILLKPSEIVRLLQRAGYTDVRLDFIVFFPKVLSFFRPFESALRWCPLGGQTMTIGSRPMGIR
jgi:SAM-dependent methyltransferase